MDEAEVCRVCNSCKEKKPISQFARNGTKPSSKYRGICKKCNSIRSSRYHSEKTMAATKAWRERNPDKYRESARKTAQKVIADMRDQYLIALLTEHAPDLKGDIPPDLIELLRGSS